MQKLIKKVNNLMWIHSCLSVDIDKLIYMLNGKTHTHKRLDCLALDRFVDLRISESDW